MKTQRGFTLIELMIVVAIIAILAAIAMSQYQDYVIRTQASEGSSLADGAKTAVGEYYNNNGRFAAANVSYGLATATSINGRYVAQLSAASGIIDITYRGSGSEVAVPLQGQHLLLSPIVNAGSIAWKCNHSASLPPKYLPSVCH